MVHPQLFPADKKNAEGKSLCAFATCKVCGYLGGLQDTLCVVGQIQRFKMLKSAEKATFSYNPLANGKVQKGKHKGELHFF